VWSIFRKLVGLIFYPDVCVYCGALGSLLCSNCYEAIEWSLLPPKLDINQPIASLEVVSMYNGPIKSLIQKLKFYGVIDVAQVGAELMYQSLNLPKVDCLVPVPMHPKRLSQRGYNQTYLLAKALGKIMDTPVANILLRTEYGLSQVEKISRPQRTQVLTRQFVINPSLQTSKLPKSVLLIDDVVTTGTTLSACVKALQTAGISVVHVATLAHGY